MNDYDIRRDWEDEDDDDEVEAENAFDDEDARQEKWLKFSVELRDLLEKYNVMLGADFEVGLFGEPHYSFDAWTVGNYDDQVTLGHHRQYVCAADIDELLPINHRR